MSTLEFDTVYSAGVRDLLIAMATPAPRSRRLPWTIGLTVAGLSLLGAGGAVAANHLVPGQDVATALDQPQTVEGVGSRHMDLGRAPAGTNSLEFTMSCSGGGEITYPNGASQTCDDDAAGTDDMPWNPAGGTLEIGASSTTSWRLTFHYSRRRSTGLGVNANGQTYGVDSPSGHPDLLYVEATNGRLGYVDAGELNEAGCGDVHSPAEALRCNREHADGTVSIPVYDSDGETRIGVFEVG